MFDACSQNILVVYLQWNGIKDTLGAELCPLFGLSSGGRFIHSHIKELYRGYVHVLSGIGLFFLVQDAKELAEKSKYSLQYTSNGSM